MSKMDDRVFLAPIIFICCAVFSAYIHADIKSVEGLEFNRVKLQGSNEVEVSVGDTTSLKILESGKKLSKSPFFVNGNTLQLGVTEQGQEPNNLKFKLRVTGLEALTIKGSGEAYVKQLEVEQLVVEVDGPGNIRMYEVSASDLDLRVSGSGTVQALTVVAGAVRLNLKGSGVIQLGSLQAESVRCTLQGSGDIAMEGGGETSSLNITLMGSGDISLGMLQAISANVSIMGSGDVTLGAVDSLAVKILGSGDVNYSGNPKIDSSIFGSGDILRRD